jgi:hypothetical protein
MPRKKRPPGEKTTKQKELDRRRLLIFLQATAGQYLRSIARELDISEKRARADFELVNWLVYSEEAGRGTWFADGTHITYRNKSLAIPDRDFNECYFILDIIFLGNRQEALAKTALGDEARSDIGRAGDMAQALVNIDPNEARANEQKKKWTEYIDVLDWHIPIDGLGEEWEIIPRQKVDIVRIFERDEQIERLPVKVMTKPKYDPFLEK